MFAKMGGKYTEQCVSTTSPECRRMTADEEEEEDERDHMMNSIGTLSLADYHAIPIRIKIALDRLFQRLSSDQIDEYLRKAGWRREDYDRGYLIDDANGDTRCTWRIPTYSEELQIMERLAAALLQSQHSMSIVDDLRRSLLLHAMTSGHHHPTSWPQLVAPSTAASFIMPSTNLMRPHSNGSSIASASCGSSCGTVDQQHHNGAGATDIPIAVHDLSVGKILTMPATVAINASPKIKTPAKAISRPIKSTTASGKRRVQCPKCDKTFCDKGALKIHDGAVHKKEMHMCTVAGCRMVFSSRRSRNRHSGNLNPKLHNGQQKLPLSAQPFRVVSPPEAAEEYRRREVEEDEEEPATMAPSFSSSASIRNNLFGDESAPPLVNHSDNNNDMDSTTTNTSSHHHQSPPPLRNKRKPDRPVKVSNGFAATEKIPRTTMVVQPATGIWQVHDDVDMKTDDTDPTQPLDLTSRTMNGSGFESITEEVESRCSSISGASSIDVDESDGDDDDPSSSSGDTSTMPINEKNPRQCAKCGKIFQNHFSVKTHYQNVHLKLMHRCSVAGCSAAFPSKRSRDRHSGNEKLHRKLLSPSPPPATDNNNDAHQSIVVVVGKEADVEQKHLSSSSAATTTAAAVAAAPSSAASATILPFAPQLAHFMHQMISSNAAAQSLLMQQQSPQPYINLMHLMSEACRPAAVTTNSSTKDTNNRSH